MISVAKKQASPAPASGVDQATVLWAITQVMDQCRTSEASQPDAAVRAELVALATLYSFIRQQWPLSEQMKQKIDLGPVAAKNIADWNPALADSLMILDYALRHDGEALSDLRPASVSKPTPNAEFA